MVAEFEQVCFYQPLHVIHGPVATKFGWHLIKITDRK
jgi:parvulin-like peptidyl-prolyl isomerase